MNITVAPTINAEIMVFYQKFVIDSSRKQVNHYTPTNDIHQCYNVMLVHMSTLLGVRFPGASVQNFLRVKREKVKENVRPGLEQPPLLQRPP